MPRQILVTAALPYANGHIHLGHLVEYIQTDIWVRFQKLRGHRCIYLCADDTHGTAIMIRARQEGRPETAVIADMQAAHERDFAAFDVEFDNYGSTNSEENRALCGEIWQSIRAAGMVREGEVTQLFDETAGTFLADRFVKGTCPKCRAPDQYGDNCEKCMATYSPTDLVNPKSTLSGATPIVKSALHLFIQLEQLHGFLESWTQNGAHLQPEIANYLAGHFLGEPLRDWDVSRPAPYFGFEIPDSPGNYWYVWFDAPIGYMASLRQWCDRTGEQFDNWWPREKGTGENPSPVEVHHFIGKDITYFHTLFWPGMLKTAGYRLPTKVRIHGFLTVNGEKMSKSKGTFVRAATYLNHLDPALLRYYYATKLTPRVDDLDMNLDEFAAKVNSDLVGKVVNLASRTARFVEATGLSPTYPDDGGLFQYAAEQGEAIAAAYDEGDYARAMRIVMGLADRANPYVEEQAPWTLKKDPAQARRLQDVCTVALNLFRQIAVYLAPVLPRLARQCGELLGTPIENWTDANSPLVGTKINPFTHMLKRVTPEEIAAMTNESRDESAGSTGGSPSPGATGGLPDQGGTGGLPTSAGGVTPTAALTSGAMATHQDGTTALAAEPLAAQCTIDDFSKIDLRVARVINAEDVPEAKKLLKLTVSLGGEDRRTVFAGIKAAYKPESLVGRLVIIVANLAPRQMKFGLSEGMVCAAGGGEKEVFLLSPDEGAVPGQRVH